MAGVHKYVMRDNIIPATLLIQRHYSTNGENIE